MEWPIFWTLLLQGAILLIPAAVAVWLLVYVAAGAVAAFYPKSTPVDLRVSETVYSTATPDPESRGFSA